MYYIGIDCGTQGTKAIVFDASTGTVIGKGYEKHPIISDDSGKREQKTQWWVDAMFAAIEDALQAAAIDRSLVRAIAISGQQHGLVVLDENKEVIRDVKLWNDTSTADDNEEIIRDAGGNEAVWHAIHTTLPVGYTASKIRYLINHEPELYARTRYVLLPHDYLNYILTGEIVTESSEASGTGYYDVQARAYSKKMLETIDPSNSLADKVPPLIAWETPVGTITEEVAKKLGLSVDVLVAAGGGDNTMSALGTGTIIEGACSLSLGTSGTVIIKTPHLDENQDRLIQIYDILGDSWLATACTLNATSASTVVQELFDVSLKTFDTLMGNAPAGAEGVKVIPFFGGERMPPLPNAKGVIKGLTSNNFSQQNLIRATAEAVVFTLYWGYKKLLEITEEPESLIINGGGANSQPWRQIVSDVFNLPVLSLAADEGGALGAALQALYLDLHMQNKATDLEVLCKQYIAIDESKTCLPQKEQVAEYQRIFQEYLQEIAQEWSISL